MDTFIVAVASAFWLGILTSISPCPLATNIAAISFIGNRVGRPGYVITAGLLYTIGRSVAYVALGIILVASLLSSSQISIALQHYLNRLLGPIMILVGMVMLGLISVRLPGVGMSESFGKRLSSFGIWGAGLLGILFALSFCPLSATLFFGSLIPLSLTHTSSVIMPLAYGIGTGLPVIVFAGIIAFSAERLGRAYNILTMIEKWARRLTGVVFILVGIYFCLIYIFHIL